MAKLDDNLAVIMPGKPEASELYNRLITKDADELMPPPESNLALSDKEKELIRRWIVEGAKWKEHWAFAPVNKPTLPKPIPPRNGQWNPVGNARVGLQTARHCA